VWHTCAIVMVSPMIGCGQLFTWGSGHHGQLGQGVKKISLIPTVSDICVDMNLSLVSVKAGQFHNAFFTTDQKLYTFGSNSCNCLGRPDVTEHFTPVPGEVIEFGKIIGKTPRGIISDYDCGRDFTVVATAPYDGPTLEEVDDAIVVEKDLDIIKAKASKVKKLLEQQEAKQKQKQAEREAFHAALKLHPLCSICEDKGTPCPGFTGNVFKPDICKECGHRRVQHTVENLEEKKRLEQEARDAEFEGKYGYGQGETKG
jgi:hypothetical protein